MLQLLPQHHNEEYKNYHEKTYKDVRTNAHTVTLRKEMTYQTTTIERIVINLALDRFQFWHVMKLIPRGGRMRDVQKRRSKMSGYKSFSVKSGTASNIITEWVMDNS